MPKYVLNLFIKIVIILFIVMASSKTRLKPNILITGTPGTGKSTLAPIIAENLGFEFIDIAKSIKENKFYSEFDEEYNSYILDEDKLLDFLQVFF